MPEDPTTLVGILAGAFSILSTAAGAIIGALWRATVRAHEREIQAKADELKALRDELGRTRDDATKRDEKRADQLSAIVREMLEHVHAVRISNERGNDAMDATKSMITTILAMLQQLQQQLQQRGLRG